MFFSFSSKGNCRIIFPISLLHVMQRLIMFVQKRMKGLCLPSPNPLYLPRETMIIMFLTRLPYKNYFLNHVSLTFLSRKPLVSVDLDK